MSVQKASVCTDTRRPPRERKKNENESGRGKKREILGGPAEESPEEEGLAVGGLAEGGPAAAFRRCGVFSKVGPRPFSLYRPGLFFLHTCFTLLVLHGVVDLPHRLLVRRVGEGSLTGTHPQTIDHRYVFQLETDNPTEVRLGREDTGLAQCREPMPAEEWGLTPEASHGAPLFSVHTAVFAHDSEVLRPSTCSSPRLSLWGNYVLFGYVMSAHDPSEPFLVFVTVLCRSPQCFAIMISWSELIVVLFWCGTEDRRV